MRKISILLAIAGTALLIASYLPATIGGSRAEPEQTLPPTPDLAAQGAALFHAKGCTSCHRHAAIQADSTQMGPDLTQYDADPAFLRRWLADPASLRPNTLMPDLDLDPADIEALIAFLERGSGETLAPSGGLVSNLPISQKYHDQGRLRSPLTSVMAPLHTMSSHCT